MQALTPYDKHANGQLLFELVCHMNSLMRQLIHLSLQAGGAGAGAHDSRDNVLPLGLLQYSFGRRKRFKAELH